jgi:dolichyl-phosphate-mannose--protein O-mannosyl transferase
MTAAIAPIFIAIASLVLRLRNLAAPKGFVFDEVYYVDGARDFLKFGVEVAGNKPEFIVHPPVGKWLIASGIQIFGDHEFGWRFATAIFGTLLILLFARLVHVLFYSPLLTSLGAFLMACDGLMLVHSRTALLDLFLTFFVLLAVYLWHQQRHWLAAIALGLAMGTKWSAIYFLIAIIFVSLYRIFSEHPSKALIRPTIKKFFQYGLLPILVYITTWSGWFISNRGWDRDWSSNPLIAWIHYHSEMLSFHTGLTQKHSYQANPWSWMVMGRPTSFFYASPKGCGSDSCAQEVLALGTPLLWWAGTIAVAVVIGFWIKSLILRVSDSALNIIVLGITAGYLPWFFFQQRTVFTFYAVIFEPFVILALVYCAKLLLDSSINSGVSQALVAAFVTVILLNFIYFLPIFSGEVITYNAWLQRMWFTSWI